MEDAYNRIGFLLGAGASAEAGIPTTFELTDKLGKGISQRAPALSQHFSVVVSGIRHEKVIMGSSLDVRINVEEVASSVKLIADRANLEIAPFVERWSPLIEQLDRSHEVAKQLIHQSLEEFRTSIHKTVEAGILAALRSNPSQYKSFFHPAPAFNDYMHGATHKFGRLLGDVISEEFSSRNGHNFKKLHNLIHRILIDIMWLSDANKVAYLRPLVEISKSNFVEIFSLNYDNCVELLFESNGLPLADGFENGIFRENWPILGRHACLYKMHGSIDWATNENGTVLKQEWDPNSSYIPTLVFGQREKLRDSGPFLDLLFKFKERLKAVDDLIVLGYSFGDKHINKFVNEWLYQLGKRLIIANGPSFEVTPFLQKRINVENTKKYCGEFLSTLENELKSSHSTIG